jgi:peptidoglycan/LPS O-acetylase OafA/YrhL
LIWPFVLIALLHRMPVSRAARVVAAAAVVAFVYLAISAALGVDEQTLYVATDGQSLGFLLAGCTTALALPVGPSLARTRFGAACSRFGVLSLAVIAPVVVLFDHNTNRFLYYGVLAVVALAMAVLLVTALVDVRLAQFLGTRPMVWLGRRSYGVYLWHFPAGLLVHWVNARYGFGWGVFQDFAVSVSLTLAIAATSFRYVEQPLRRRLNGSAHVISSMRSSATLAQAAVSSSTTI